MNSGRKKLAIVSSYNENCGNASYTFVLKEQFSKYYEVDVLALDLFVIQKSGKDAVDFADRHIKDLCVRLREYDYVNIQFESGLYGARLADVLRRAKWLIDAAPNLIFTMHRIDLAELSGTRAIWNAVKARSLQTYIRASMPRRYASLYRNIIDHCAAASKSKNVWIKVHTKREKRIVADFYGFKNCVDFPLAFLSRDQRSSYLQIGDRDQQSFKEKHNFPAYAKVIGLFGYITDYKGIETAVRAMSSLPYEYHIGLFGSQHPQSIRPHVEIDPYLKTLLKTIDEATADQFSRADWRVTAQKKLNRDTSPRPVSTVGELQSDADDEAEAAPQPSPTELSSRVRFIGNLPDPDFIEALRLCDAVALPYLEVGQSMSGVLALSMEAGAKVFCANNLSFFEARKYYGEIYHNFDIGNHVELAQKISVGGEDFRTARDKVYEKYNIYESIRLQMRLFEKKGDE